MEGSKERERDKGEEVELEGGRERKKEDYHKCFTQSTRDWINGNFEEDVS